MSNISPNLLLIGPGRTGTTSLFEFLRMHPGIQASISKETQIFRPAILDDPVDLGLFSAQFPSPSGSLLLEGSPSSFQGGSKVARQILKANRDAKVIITLRSPVERFISNFQFTQSKVKFDKNYTIDDYMRDTIEVFENGFRSKRDFSYSGLIETDYERLLDEWKSVFPPNQILIVFYENIGSHFEQVYADIAKFAGFDPSLLDATAMPHTNKGSPVRSVVLHRLAMTLNNGKAGAILSKLRLKKAMQIVYYGLNGKRRPETAIMRDKVSEFIGKYISFDGTFVAKVNECQVSHPIPAWLSR